MEQLLIILVPALPLLSALVNHLAYGQLGRRVARLSVVLAVFTFVVSAVLLAQAMSGNDSNQVALGDTWGILLADPLSTLMGILIAGISLIVRMYSVRYMIEEQGYGRFFMLLDLMTATLLIMVAAGDLLTLIVAWHLVGVLLYFLLGFDSRSKTAYRYAFWTLITYRIGDIALVLAAVLLFHAFGTWTLADIFAGIAENPGAHQYFGFALEELVGVLLAIAAFARSAQFFLHTWLPYSMDGPTPVSALMHAGIVNAGGFLINRFAVVFIHTDSVMHLLFVVGLVTAIIGSILMLMQNDIKKALGYSTMGQMGFMIMECGVGAFSLAIYHLIAHGLFKGTLFLGAGTVINEARKSDGVPKDELYTFIVEHRITKRHQPWLLMAGITLIVPIIILFFAHWLVAQDFFQKQGAIVLLFFGWVTGAQLLFTTYRMGAQNVWRLVGVIVLSFAVIVLGYAAISHAFDLFLYPDPEFSSQISSAASIDIFWFDVLVVLTTAFIVGGWLLKYYSEKNRLFRQEKVGLIWTSFYALVSREFYIMDIYAWLTRRLLTIAGRLNILLRWR
ncbi:NADH-quinone oxidoreductase subunit L [Gammaproteobacteria bacterium AH-315-C21]|nr:NADH-quinone oxidoreductase subunit L [Gammaproteobacteria bacterium AH-315-C21]